MKKFFQKIETWFRKNILGQRRVGIIRDFEPTHVAIMPGGGLDIGGKCGRVEYRWQKKTPEIKAPLFKPVEYPPILHIKASVKVDWEKFNK